MARDLDRYADELMLRWMVQSIDIGPDMLLRVAHLRRLAELVRGAA